MSHNRLLAQDLDINLPYQSAQIQIQQYGSHEKDSEEDYQIRKAKRKRCAFHIGFFILGASLALLIVFLVWRFKPSGHGGNRSDWNAFDYEENWQYYASGDPHPINIEDNMRLSRLDRPILSPSGYIAVFTRTQYDQQHLNRSATSLWYYYLPYTDGYSALPLTKPIWGVHDSQPYFDLYSRTVFFLSNRDLSGNDLPSATTQIYQVFVPSQSSLPSIPLVEPVSYMGGLTSYVTSWWSDDNHALEGQQTSSSSSSSTRRSFLGRLNSNMPTRQMTDSKGDVVPVLPDASYQNYATPTQLTSYPLSISNLMVGYTEDPATTRSLFAFSVRVFPNTTIMQTAQMLKQRQESGGNSLEFDKLFVRHWDEYMDGTRNHVFLMSVSQNDDASVGVVTEPVDLMFEDDSDAPTRPDGDATSQWSFSTSGINFAFVRQTWDPYANVSWNTNLDIYTVSIPSSLGSTFSVVLPAVCRTCDNIATDTNPVFSPVDDNAFVYLSTAVPGYESDRYRLKFIRTANSPAVDMTPKWNLSITSVTWTSVNNSVYLTAQSEAREKLYQFNLDDLTSTVLLSEGTNGNVQASFDNSFFLYTASSHDSPTGIFVYYYNASTYNVSIGDMSRGFNEIALSRMQLSTTQEYFFQGYNGTQIQSWFWLPTNFDHTKKYPLAFLIHGGPQVPWSSAWSYRWNPQIYAAAGYAVSMINFHGTFGWGQDFVDSIQGQYGSIPYQDLMMGLASIVENSSKQWNLQIDTSRLVALGASYGGYMINWIAGHQVQAKYPFAALVVHDGIFDVRAMYYSTDELFFMEHDTPGVPWVNASNYEKWNPANPDLVAQWNTPQLVIHGGRDYRIDISQGLGVFTALQRQGIPSKFLYFPDENHQVFNTINQIQWHATVLDWIGQYTSTPGFSPSIPTANTAASRSSRAFNPAAASSRRSGTPALKRI